MIIRAIFITTIRDKISLFYAAIFPIILMIGVGIFVDSVSYYPQLVTAVLAISTLFWGVQGTAFQVFGQRNKGVYKMLKVTPYKTLYFIIMNAIVRALLGIAINLLVLMIGVIYFDLQISVIGTIQLIGILAIGTSCFSCLGIFISNLAKNEGQINMLANLIQIPMVFCSQAFYSLEKAPSWINVIGEIHPFEYFSRLISGSLFTSINDMVVSLIILVCFTLEFLFLGVTTFKWEVDQPVFSVLKGTRVVKKTTN
ncbi:ABC transporter permease [Cytobacillus sp. Hm23]